MTDIIVKHRQSVQPDTSTIWPDVCNMIVTADTRVAPGFLISVLKRDSMKSE